MDLSRVKKLRKSKGLTQTKVAEMLGISQSTYSAYESGERYPNAEVLGNMANIFDVSVDYLLGRESE